MSALGFLRRNGDHVIAKSLLDEVTTNINLINVGQALNTNAWQAIVATEKVPALGDAAYAAQIAYKAAATFNAALDAYYKNFVKNIPGKPAPAPGEREAYEEFLASQRNQLLETFGGLKKDLQARVGS
ncbi:MAG: hypothetical protein HY438_02270 [DPANN group archaeon]|nr:hypothetical protein [DPANN group archaeon]